MRTKQVRLHLQALLEGRAWRAGVLVWDELAAAVADAGVEDVAVLLVRDHGPGGAARVVALFVAGGGVVSLEFSQVQYLIRGGGEEIMSLKEPNSDSSKGKIDGVCTRLVNYV